MTHNKEGKESGEKDIGLSQSRKGLIFTFDKRNYV